MYYGIKLKNYNFFILALLNKTNRKYECESVTNSKNFLNSKTQIQKKSGH